MDGQGQAPAVAAVVDPALAALDTATPSIPTAIQVPLAGLESPSVSTAATTPAPLTDLAGSSTSADRPDGPESSKDSPARLDNARAGEDEKEIEQTPVNTITVGAALPADVTSSIPTPVTLNADAVNAAGEAEHAARVDEEAKVENAILEADKSTQNDNKHRQRTPLTDLSLAHTNATIQSEHATPHSPPSPSSTSALSSVTASAAPSTTLPTPSNQSTKDAREDEEEASEIATESDNKKPRSTGGRNARRSAASNGVNGKETGASSSSSSTRRSEKPASTSSTSNGQRTRGASAQSQPQRQSSRSKASTGASSATNTRPSRQRGSPDPKDGNDTTPGTRRSRRTRQTTAQNGRANGDEEESDDGDEGITRCVCGNNDDESSAFMIQCETCKAWQHGPCVGFKYENDCPDTYYCEQCRPDLHPTLTSRGKKHARSASASSRPANTSAAASKDEKEDTLARSTSSNKPLSRDHRELSTTSLPATATSSGHPSYHRARSSADAAIISSFLETSQHSPSPAADPGSPGSREGSSDGGSSSKRPMYPPTSHFSAPQNPKRRSTMNSRDSAAFDESILLATQQAFRESRAMAMELGVGGAKGRKRKKRDDDDMEPVKEEEEEYHDDYRQDTKIKRENGHKEDRQDDSAVDPSLASHDEEHDDEGEGDDQDDQSADANGTAAPRKRRRRRGAGALFTAPNKKRAATARAKKTNGDAGDGAQHEGFTVNSIQIEDASSAVEDDANARKRKRDDANQDGERAVSPDASHDTSSASHSSSDKPLAQANKRPKPSPSETPVETESEAPAPQTVTNILGSTLQIAIPTSNGEDSAAPSPAGSAAPGQADATESVKEQDQPDAANDQAGPKGKKTADTDRDESTPAPTAPGDESNSGNLTVNGKGIRQPNQYTYKRGGPGSRGGFKGSPSKRAALAAAAEARHGRHRDDTPSTYEDWINQPPNWGLPDHLSHLSHLLPSQNPLPLQVTKFVTSPNNSVAASPVTPQVEAGSSGQQTNSDSAPPIPAITVSNSLEPSAKIRFPSRRMSVAEMRKRAKSMLDYLARVQVDTIDRNNRNRALAAVQESIINSQITATEKSLTPPPSMLFNKDSPLTPQATSLIEDLSRQLNSFQEKFL